MRTYGPALVLVVWALFVGAGADPIATLIPFLLAEAIVVAVYITHVRRTLRGHRPRDRR